MPPRRPTVPGGVPTYSPTPTPVMGEDVPTPAMGSRSFVTILSTILGIVLATSAVLGVVGKYFYVDRGEYTQKILQDADERANVQKVLVRFESTMAQQSTTLERQEKAFDRMAETVRALELGRGRR